MLSESYCLALYGDGQGCGGGLFRMNLVVGKFICSEFAFLGKNRFNLAKGLKATQVHDSDTPAFLTEIGGGVGSKP